VGITVHIGARVAASAVADEVRVSSTVRDMVAGAGIGFIDRGLQTLKGVPGKWRLFSVEGASSLISSLTPTSDTGANTSTGSTVTESSAIIRREADYWTVMYGGKSMTLRHSKGLSHLAHLLRNPGREFSATELAAASEASDGTLRFEGPASGKLRDSAMAERVVTLGDAGEILDATAKADYKRRLAEIDTELAEAESFNDLGKTETLGVERDLLQQQIANALGLGGRNRRAASHSERARVNVTKLIKATIRKINSNNRQLGLHLANSVRTGTFCSYTPESHSSPAWQDR
jgi:hypothetical protein